MAKVVGLVTREECDKIIAAGYSVRASLSSPEESDNMFWITVWVDCDVIELLDIKEEQDERLSVLRGVQGRQE